MGSMRAAKPVPVHGRLSDAAIDRLRSATGAVVYLAGPMTGVPTWNQDAFDHAAARLTGPGRRVFNPAGLFDGDKSRRRSEYMRADFRQLLTATDLVLLPGFIDSRGAMLELRIARELELRVWGPDGLALADGAALKLAEPLPDVTSHSGVMVGNHTCDAHAAAVDAGMDTRVKQPETCLEEAQRLVYGDRGAAYGHPLEDYAATGAMFGALLQRWAVQSANRRGASPLPVPARLACLLMVAVKASREARVSKRDNRTDMAGYAECLQRIADAESGA